MNKRIKALIACTIVLTTTLVPLGNKMRGIEVKADSEGKAKNVILMVVDGMSTEALTLARYYKGSDLAMDSITTGGVETYWENGPITDSAPAATALASGQKTLNKYIGTSKENTPLATILEGAEAAGKSTGIIATSEITHATPADFAAHIENRANYNAILRQQINNEMEVVLGGGFGSDSKYEGAGGYEAYKEERINEIKEEGFSYVETKDQFNKFDGNKLWGSFASADMKYDLDNKLNGSEEPTLSEMTGKAIDVLNKEENGFFLMVEGSKVDWAAHANEPAAMASDIVAFDDAVANAIEFAKADGNTVVIVTTDHGNSGITIGSNEFNESVTSYDKATFEQTVDNIKKADITEESFTKLINGKSDAEIKKLALQHYGYDLTNDEISIVKTQGIKDIVAKKCGLGFTTGGHTGEDVYLGVYAPSNVNKLSGVVNNTDINKYMQNILLDGVTLNDITANNYMDGEVALSKIEGVSLEVQQAESYNPIVNITKGDKVVKLELFTNNYEIDGEKFESKSVMPYIKGKFYISKELVDIIASLEGGTR
ncbi:MAG: alkaline phosphatase [Clostridium sp.]